jgi:phage-related protein (TIGR01555 family)
VSLFGRVAKFFRTDAAPVANSAPAALTTTRKDSAGLSFGGYSNPITGLGMSGTDSRNASSFHAGYMTDEIAIEMWRGDLLAGKIVSLLPKEALEPGVTLTIQDEKRTVTGAADTRNAGDLVEDVERCHRDLGTEAMIVKAGEWERLFGGAAIWAGANDYQADSFAEPLNLEAKMLRIKWLEVLRSRDLTPVRYYTDALHPKFGKVEVWRLSRVTGGGTIQQQAEIHESRLFLFRGRRIVEDGTVITQNLQSTEFGDGILLAVQGALRRFQESLDNTELAMRANGELLWQHNRLSEILANEGEDDFRKLVSAMNFASSILRARVVGADQTLTRQSISLAGLADIVTKFENELAAISDTPRTKLFGDVPGGLGNNFPGPHGDWDETKAVYRRRSQLPAYEWITKLIFRSLGGEPRRWKLEGKPYRHPTEPEQGALVKLEGETDIALLSAGVVTAEEVRARTIWRDRYALPDPEEAAKLDEMPADIRDPNGGAPPAPTAPEEPRLAEVALNGAQALAISAITEKVAAGILPRESAVAQLMYSFKAPRDVAEQMVPQDGFRPRAVESGLVAPPAEVVPPRSDKRGPARRGDAIDVGATLRFTYAPLPPSIVKTMEALQADVMPAGSVAQEIDHVTLVYCPKATDDIPRAEISEVVAALRSAAAGTAPIAAKVQGWAYFDGARKDGEDKTALVALIDAPGITQLQVRLQDALAAAGMEPSSAHSFAPHFTICYLDPGDRVDDLPMIAAEFTIDRVCFSNREVHEILLVQDAHRLDCEKPIQSDDGKFAGCEPGSGSASPSIDKEHAARASRISSLVKVPAAKTSEHKAAAEKYLAQLQRGLTAGDAPFMMSTMSGEDEQKKANSMQRQVDAIASGAVQAPPRDQLDRYLSHHRPAIDAKLASIGSDIGKAHDEAALALAKLKGYGGDGLDHDDIEGAVGDLYDEAGIAGSFEIRDADTVEELEPPDQSDSTADYNEAAEKYNAGAESRIKGQRDAAEQARDALIKLQGQQDDITSRLKTIAAEHRKLATPVIDEGDVEYDEQVDPELADVVAEIATDNDRSDLTSLSVPSDALKRAKTATKKMIKALDRFLAKPAPKPDRFELKDPNSEDAGDE